MQTNFKDYSDFFNRIMQIIDYKEIKSVNIFATQYLNYDAPQKINRLKTIGNNPSYEIISDIVNKFEEIDANWLITGKGSMLKTVESSIHVDKNLTADGPNEKNDSEYWKNKYIALQEKYSDLQERYTSVLEGRSTESFTADKSTKAG